MSYAPPPKARPSGATYLIPVFVWLVFTVGACVGGGGQAINGLADSVDKLERVPASTGGPVELEAGKKYVYFDDGTGDTTSGPNSRISITDPAGNQVDLDDLTTDETYSADGSSGVGILRFDAPTDGTYTVTVEGGSELDQGELLIGENIFAAAKDGLILLVVIGTIGFIVAVIIAIVIARKRGKSKREMQGGGGSWPGGGQGYQPQGGYAAPSAYPPQGGYGAPASYPPAGGGYPPQQPGYPPPGNQPPPGSFPPQGGGFPPAGGGYQPPPGGFPPSGS